MNNKKIFVLDTNILIHEPTAFFSFEEHDVTIPMTVLEELDNLKDRKGYAAHDARIAIKAIENILTDASPEQIVAGVTMKAADGKERGKLSIFNDYELDQIEKNDREVSGLGGFYGGGDSPDNSIIQAAIYLQNQNPNRVVALVTKDINMRLKSKSMGMEHVEDYKSDLVVDDVKYLAKGYHKFEGDFWSKVDDCVTEKSGKKCVHQLKTDLFESPYINQYIYDETENFAGKIIGFDDKNTMIQDKGFESLMSKKAWNITPNNIQQGMAMDALLDPETEMVILTGNAGCGKTILSLACSLHMVLEQNLYDKIIVTRSTPLIAEDIGLLPGTEEEKMLPWLAAITDSMEALHREDHDKSGSMNYIMEKANVQFKSVNFMRGRSIQDAIIILDEAQNLTPSQLKTIISRCSDNCKLLILGNLKQIDATFINALTSGLTTVVEKFKNFEGSAVINLKGVARSRLAAFAEDNL